eukprot:COSAG06_NODE_55401_length_289_cov_1.815789_1_plen_34_part_10
MGILPLRRVPRLLLLQEVPLGKGKGPRENPAHSA